MSGESVSSVFADKYPPIADRGKTDSRWEDFSADTLNRCATCFADDDVDDASIDADVARVVGDNRGIVPVCSRCTDHETDSLAAARDRNRLVDR